MMTTYLANIDWNNLLKNKTAYEMTLKSEADSVEAIWCNIVTRNSTLTIGVVYRSPNIGQEEDVKLQKAIREVSKGECVIMGDFNHGHIQ